jgi:hypothetical protein
MKTIIIAATSASVVFGMAFAREVVLSPLAPIHAKSVIVESRVAQLNSIDRESNVSCMANYITSAKGDGNRTTRKSVDCEE